MIPRFSPNYGLWDLARAVFGASTPGRASERAGRLVGAETGCSYVTLAPSGRGALYLLLKSLPPGRVIVPAYTCSAVVESARLAGRDVVTTEHREGRLNLEVDDLGSIVRPGDIIVATHQYGFPCGIAELVSHVQGRGGYVIEDIAAALGARSGGRPVGSFGLACIGSFDTSKLVHSPLKGGFIGTNDSAISKKVALTAAQELEPMPWVRRFSIISAAALLVIVTKQPLYAVFYWLNFQLKGRYTAEDGEVSDEKGPYYRYQLADWQAAIVVRQLARLQALIERRARIFELYRREIKSCPAFDVETAEVERPGAVIRFPVYATGDKLDLHRKLARIGVDTGFSFSTIASPRSQKNAWSLAERVLNIPFSTSLTERQVKKIVATLKYKVQR
jgi:dTDP-4-amino-4,6-dideoxygalactose transaminase